MIHLSLIISINNYMENLDDKDFEILNILQRDARASHVAIGKEIGLTGPSVYSRIQRLEKTGVILGYTTQIDGEKVRQGLVAFVRLSVKTAALTGDEEDFTEYVLQEPNIIDCFDVDGEDSYILKVRAESPQHLRLIVAGIRAQPAVVSTITSIALLQIKDAGVIAPVKLEGRP
jgi:Lrp/AsnC family transcriptional regulator, leucine-responsive regulatory protein